MKTLLKYYAIFIGGLLMSCIAVSAIFIFQYRHCTPNEVADDIQHKYQTIQLWQGEILKFTGYMREQPPSPSRQGIEP